MNIIELFNETTKYLNENNIRPYTNVIADEFQDFSNPELKFLRALVAEGRNDLFLTGDPMQRIYSGRKINFGAAGINVRGVRSRRLKINYRTTEPIKKVAVSVIKGITFEDMDGGTESMNGYVSLIHGGEKPIYKIVGSASEEVLQICEWISECLNNNIVANDICIAAPNMGLIKELQSYLHINGIEYTFFDMGAGQKEHHEQVLVKLFNDPYETVFIPARSENMFLSSSVIKQVCMLGGDVTPFIPKEVSKEIIDKLMKG